MTSIHKMKFREKHLLKQFGDGQDPIELIKSTTKIDTGGWMRNSNLWLAIFKDEVVVMAIGRRKYIDRAPLTDITQTHYCHTTGELVLAPIQTMIHRRLKMSPGDSLRAFDALGINPSTLSNHT